MAITSRQKSARRKNIAVARAARKKGKKRGMSLIEHAQKLVKEGKVGPFINWNKKSKRKLRATADSVRIRRK